MSSLTHDVIVIGGGAAGMLSSAVAASRGLKVLLIEQNEKTGKKLNITGKGRCNLTNSCSVRDVLENIPSGGKFMYSALTAFSPQSTMDFFENLGVKLKIERGNRVFPLSDRAADINAALTRHMKKTGVQLKTAKVVSISANGAVSGVITDQGTFSCKNVILCTGGASYPLTGSRGDGYKMAEDLGHNIVSIRPSLVPLTSDDDVCEKMQGLSLRNVRLYIYDSKDKLIFDDFGELLFTHFGLTGPLVLSASAHIRDFENENYYAVIDLKPVLDEKKLDARILRDFEKFSNRDFSNALSELANRLMIPVIIEKSQIPPDTKVHSITKEQRKTLLNIFKSFRINISGTRPIDEAIITSGGVDLKEVNPKTMESKLISGLYFAGEVLDLDAYTGGFNLQIAWSTAYAAATHIPLSE